MTGQAVVRQQFRHAWRPARPPHTIRVDEAIDAVGLAMFPDRWGTQPEFDRLPIFRVRGQLVHLEPIEAPGFRKVVVESTENLEPLALDFSAAYKAVRTALRRGVPAAYVTFDGRQRELRREL